MEYIIVPAKFITIKHNVMCFKLANSTGYALGFTGSFLVSGALSQKSTELILAVTLCSLPFKFRSSWACLTSAAFPFLLALATKVICFDEL